MSHTVTRYIVHTSKEGAAQLIVDLENNKEIEKTCRACTI